MSLDGEDIRNEKVNWLYVFRDSFMYMFSFILGIWRIFFFFFLQSDNIFIKNKKRNSRIDVKFNPGEGSSIYP